MRKSMWKAIIAGGVALAGTQATAIDIKPATEADYSALAKLPDWTGVWQPDWASMFGGASRAGGVPAFTAAGAKMDADFKAGRAKGENLQTEAANCVPSGMPQIMRMPYPIEFLFNPDRVSVITETYSQVRRIYTDGRPLPDDPDPAFNGWSTGKWEGDTLVVDTVGLNPKNSIVPGIHPTEQTRIRETIRLEKPDVLLLTITITDPTLFTEPFVIKQPYARHRDWEMREYVCQENNKDAADEFGRPSMKIEE